MGRLDLVPAGFNAPHRTHARVVCPMQEFILPRRAAPRLGRRPSGSPPPRRPRACRNLAAVGSARLALVSRRAPSARPAPWRASFAWLTMTSGSGTPERGAHRQERTRDRACSWRLGLINFFGLPPPSRVVSRRRGDTLELARRTPKPRACSPASWLRAVTLAARPRHRKDTTYKAVPII